MKIKVCCYVCGKSLGYTQHINHKGELILYMDLYDHDSRSCQAKADRERMKDQDVLLSGGE